MSRPDLNLLTTLDVLLTEGSVARAAARLQLSPSAMSRTLARLRETTGDPLLVRAGRGLVPTLLQWNGAAHPAERLQDSQRRLVSIAGEHPEPAGVRDDLAALGLSDTLKVTYAKSPRLAAMIRTPQGVATL